MGPLEMPTLAVRPRRSTCPEASCCSLVAAMLSRASPHGTLQALPTISVDCTPPCHCLHLTMSLFAPRHTTVCTHYGTPPYHCSHPTISLFAPHYVSVCTPLCQCLHPTMSVFAPRPLTVCTPPPLTVCTRPCRCLHLTMSLIALLDVIDLRPTVCSSHPMLYA